MLRFLKSQLSPHYQVLEAVDGQQAIEKASQFLPDIILLDMMMPEKDGLQACREIREHTPTQSIPIILLTARADEETKLARVVGRRERLPDEAVFHHRTARAHQEPRGIAPIPAQGLEAEPGAGIHHRAAQGNRDATGADREAGFARPHERGHHSRNQQPAELRHHRPVHAAQQGQVPRAGAAGGICRTF